MKHILSFFLCFFSYNLVFGAVCKDLLLKNSLLKTSKVELAKAIEQARLADNVPGLSYSVFDANNIIISDTSGYGNVEETFALSAQTSLFRTASVSKMLASFSAAQLIEKGQLDPEASILDYGQTSFVKHILSTETAERVSNWRKIKIKHLMNHQAGISKDLPGVLVFFNSEGVVNNSYPTMEDLFKGLSDVEFLYEPGEVEGGSKYSNLAINLLALLVEGVNEEGLSFPAYVSKNIFDRLGMAVSTYNLDESQQEQLVFGYGQKLLPIDQVFRVGSYAGSIGFATSSDDMAKLGQFILNATSFSPNALLDLESSVERLFLPAAGSYIAPNEPLASVPFWRVLPGSSNETGVLWVGHTGTGFSERAFLMVAPEYGIGIAINFNTSAVNREKYANLILEHLNLDSSSNLNQQTQALLDTVRNAVLQDMPESTQEPTRSEVSELAPFLGYYYADNSYLDRPRVKLEDVRGGGYAISFFGHNLLAEDVEKGLFRFPNNAGVLWNSEPVQFLFDENGQVNGVLIANVKRFELITE